MEYGILDYSSGQTRLSRIVQIAGVPESSRAYSSTWLCNYWTPL